MTSKASCIRQFQSTDVRLIRSTNNTRLKFPCRPLQTPYTRRNKHSVVKSNSNDDEAPVIMEDWRAFRASLIATQEEQQTGNPWASRLTEPNREVLKEQNPRLFLEEMWAHITATPEVGGLIIATSRTPTLIGKNMWQVVMLLLEHSSKGSAALILNRPTALTLGRLGTMYNMNVDEDGNEVIDSRLANNRLYHGGFEAERVMVGLHGHKSIEGTEVASGIYYSGYDSVLKGLDKDITPNDFKFFAGLVAFAPGELEQQVEQGAWYCANCSRSLVLKQCLQLPVPLWVEVMRLMGDEYAAEAQRAIDEMYE